MLLILAACLVDQGLYREVRAEFHDDDGDGITEREGDCDDADVAIMPGADELCDGLDNDCNGVVDEEPPGQVWYEDRDGDGYGDDLNPVHQCSRPEGVYLSEAGDCDDDNAGIHPGATEYCDVNDVDEDCDGVADNGDEDAVGRRDWYGDADGDGFGVPGEITTTCDQPAGYAAVDTDCDDADEAVFPGADEVCNELDDNCDGDVDVDPIDGTVYFADLDADGYGDPNTYVLSCDPIEGYLVESGDCDDADAEVNPAAQEVCDDAERDEDCDTFTDDGDTSAVGQTVFFPDADGDGHGAGTEFVVACDPPLDYGVGFDDCDDADPLRYPGAIETCDPVDSDCDGSTDDADAVDAQTWYADTDADGYGSAPVSGCVQPADAVNNDLDCDDTDGTVWPGAPEQCDGVDNDCDGYVDENVDLVWYDDVDGDGYGAVSGIHGGCPDDAAATTVGGDCDDADPDVSPAGQEVCDDAERDEDCDGRADDGDDSVVGGATWYADADGDGHGDPATGAVACWGAVDVGDDCDDADARVWPGQYEVCNGWDDNCDGVVDTDAVDLGTSYVDADGDGYGAAAVDGCSVGAGVVSVGGDCDDGDAEANPGMTEVCENGVDDDCDGTGNGCRLEGGYTTDDADIFVVGPDDTEEWTLKTAEGWDFDGDGWDDWIAYGLVDLAVDTRGWALTDIRSGTASVVGSGPIGAAPDGLGTYDYGDDVDADGLPDIRVSFVSSWGPVVGDMVTGFSVPVEEFTESTLKAWVVYSDEPASQFGKYGSEAGDVNGDGQADLVVCADASADGAFNGGAAYVWFGPVAALEERAEADATMVGLVDHAMLWKSDLCDLDGDGVDELVLTEMGYEISSADVGGVAVFQSPLADGAAESDADVVYDGRGANHGIRQGYCIDDLSGDGLADLLVHSPSADTTATSGGAANVITGVGSGALRVVDESWASFGGATTDAEFGSNPRVADVDDDGSPDILLAGADLGGGFRGVALFYAPTSAAYSTDDADARFEQTDSSGFNVGTPWVSDVDRDGLADILISDTTWVGSTGSGAAYVFFGSRL